MPLTFKLPTLRIRWQRILSGFFCTLCLTISFPRTQAPAPTLWPNLSFETAAAVAQMPSIKRATITQVLDSSQVFIQNRQAKVNDAANQGQQVRTGRARAQLAFNTGAVGRLAHNSVLTVGQCAQLHQGTLLVNGAMNGCTSSVVAGVRGTTYVLEAKSSGATQIKVLEGRVAVRRQSLQSNLPASKMGWKQFKLTLPQLRPLQTSSNRTIGLPVPVNAPPAFPVPDPLAPNATDVILSAGEKIAVSSTGSLGVIEKLTRSDFTNLLTGELFKGFMIPLPGLEKLQRSFETLFPGIPFPTIPQPRISIPLPIRLPLPF